MGVGVGRGGRDEGRDRDGNGGWNRGGDGDWSGGCEWKLG